MICHIQNQNQEEKDMSLKSNRLIYKEYKQNPEIKKDVNPLFISAFPRDERPPSDIYFSNFERNNNSLLWAFYDKETFVGFASFILYKDICYVFFLAVQDEYRNQGYGTEILSLIKEEFKNYVILLCYEEVNGKYKDNDMRTRRANFYHRNGFVINPLKTYEFGVIFQTAIVGHRNITFEEYKQIFIIGFGFKDDDFLQKHLKEVN